MMNIFRRKIYREYVNVFMKKSTVRLSKKTAMFEFDTPEMNFFILTDRDWFYKLSSDPTLINSFLSSIEGDNAQMILSYMKKDGFYFLNGKKVEVQSNV